MKVFGEFPVAFRAGETLNNLSGDVDSSAVTILNCQYRYFIKKGKSKAYELLVLLTYSRTMLTARLFVLQTFRNYAKEYFIASAYSCV